jgi:DNA-binding NarL/FixJ family response regulator
MTKPDPDRPTRIAERNNTIIRLTKQGWTAQQIAEHVGLCTRSITRIRVATGIAQPFTGHPLTPQEHNTAQQLLNDGASYAEIGRTLGRSDKVIATHFPGQSQWRRGQGNQWRTMKAKLERC